MRHLTPREPLLDADERARFGLRIAVCTRCSARPAGSEALGAASPRACEPACELFDQLPALLRTARCIDPMVGSFGRIMEGHLKPLSRVGTASAGSPADDTCRPRPRFRHTEPIIRVLRRRVAH
jgi:hypothetical protein